MSERTAQIRPPAVASFFYPSDANTLDQMVDDFIQSYDDIPASPAPKAVIVPHAGYMYSGSAAVQALKRFTSDKASISRIILMGPCHRVAIRGLVAPRADAFATPLGTIEIDRKAIDDVASFPFVSIDDAPHAEEHSLEVQLPLLQKLIGEFTLVPFAVGTATAEQVGVVLDTLWGGDETRIVISSDLSHFLTQDQAMRMDEKTALAIERLDWQSIEYEQACGRVPISGLLAVARQRNISAERIALLTSADTAGTPDRVVGYGAWAFS